MVWGAEEPLPVGGSCLLGSFNLSAYVKDETIDDVLTRIQNLKEI